MSRRITFTTVEPNSRGKAIQPNGDDLERVLEVVLAAQQSYVHDHDGMTVVHVTATKEVEAGGTESSKVDHRRKTLVIFEHLPQNIVEKEAARGDAATGPDTSDQRLVQLTTRILKRIDVLVFDSFMVELMKESGRQVGKNIVTLASLLIALFLYLVFYR